ncbi:MAG TPA: rhodanese-like domain-containing protein [Ilumatobacteraceae bacterium]|nr:rhodanese-like domain-containing protein [Ilumatobacteraceae bacterium]
MAVQEVSLEAFAAALEAGLVGRVVDVREPGEYAAGHVPGAVLVPLANVPDSIDAFAGDGPTYVVCQVGGPASTWPTRMSPRSTSPEAQRHGSPAVAPWLPATNPETSDLCQGRAATTTGSTTRSVSIS